MRRLKRVPVYVIMFTVEMIALGLTMWMVKLSYVHRGYMAFGGEWGLLIMVNILFLMILMKLEEKSWII